MRAAGAGYRASGSREGSAGGARVRGVDGRASPRCEVSVDGRRLDGGTPAALHGERHDGLGERIRRGQPSGTHRDADVLADRLSVGDVAVLVYCHSEGFVDVSDCSGTRAENERG